MSQSEQTDSKRRRLHMRILPEGSLSRQSLAPSCLRRPAKARTAGHPQGLGGGGGDSEGKMVGVTTGTSVGAGVGAIVGRALARDLVGLAAGPGTGTDPAATVACALGNGDGDAVVVASGVGMGAETDRPVLGNDGWRSTE